MAESVRPRMADAIAEVFDIEFLRELATEVKSASKGVPVDVELNCRECGAKNRKKVVGEVRDLAKIVSVVTHLLEQSEGKPGTADAQDAGVVLVVERRWPVQEGGAPDAGTSDPDRLPPAA